MRQQGLAIIATQVKTLQLAQVLGGFGGLQTFASLQRGAAQGAQADPGEQCFYLSCQ